MIQSDKKPRTWTIECILEWLRIREKEGHAFPADVQQLETEVDRSALLQRLIAGQKPLPIPPPLAFGTPWYQLIEEGQAFPYEVQNDEIPGNGPIHTVTINGFDWDVAEHVDQNDYIVRYCAQGGLWHLWLVCMAGDENGASRKVWKLVKM